MADDKSKSKSQKTVEESDGSSIDLSEGSSKPYLDEDGGYTEVNRAGPDEPRMDNVKAHGEAAEPLEPWEQGLDREQILNQESDEDKKSYEEKAKQSEKNHLELSKVLEKQRAPKGVGEGYQKCPNCGTGLYTAGDKLVAV